MAATPCTPPASLCTHRLQPHRPNPAQPALLDAWERLADGRYAGTAEGRPVWLTVSLEGAAALGPARGRPGTSRPSAVASTSSARRPPAREAPGSRRRRCRRRRRRRPPSTDWAALARPCLSPPPPPPRSLSRAAWALARRAPLSPPPPPPPPPATQKVVFLAPPRQAPASTAPAGTLAPAPLTLGEQRERQENRVRSDEAKLQMLETRLQARE